MDERPPRAFPLPDHVEWDSDEHNDQPQSQIRQTKDDCGAHVYGSCSRAAGCGHARPLGTRAGGPRLPPALPRIDRRRIQGPHPGPRGPLAGLHAGCGRSVPGDPRRPQPLLRSHLSRQHGRDSHGRLRHLRVPEGAAGSGHPPGRSQERHLQDLCGGGCVPHLRGDHRSRPDRRNGPGPLRDLRRDLPRRHLRAARLHHCRQPGERRGYPGLLQPAPRHRHPGPGWPAQRPEGGGQGDRARQGRHLRSRRGGHRRSAPAHARRCARCGGLRPRGRALPLPAEPHELGKGVPGQGDEPAGPARRPQGDAPGRRCLHWPLNWQYRH